MSRKTAFTLIELLVVVAIIAMLIAMLAPALTRARAQTKLVTCRSNLRTIGHGIQFYVDDYRGYFPEAPFYGCLGYKGRSLYHSLLGSQIPENLRPLNQYFKVERSITEGLSAVDMADQDVIFECPSDKGDAYFNLEGTYFVEHGTSYTYASDCYDPFVPTFGVQSCRGLMLEKVENPVRKIVFQEPVIAPSFNMGNPLAHWHDTERNHGNVLFADGHVDLIYTQIFEWDADPNELNPYY